MPEQQPQQKVWGTTIEIVSTEFYSRHVLEVVAGGYCSLHFHRQRANRFTVVDATVAVVTFMGPQIKTVLLEPGYTLDVPSLVPHMFVVHANGTMYEEYYPDRGGSVRNDDIVRLMEGGIVGVDNASMVPYQLFIEYFQTMKLPTQ